MLGRKYELTYIVDRVSLGVSSPQGRCGSVPHSNDNLPREQELFEYHVARELVDDLSDESHPR